MLMAIQSRTPAAKSNPITTDIYILLIEDRNKFERQNQVMLSSLDIISATQSWAFDEDEKHSGDGEPGRERERERSNLQSQELESKGLEQLISIEFGRSTLGLKFGFKPFKSAGQTRTQSRKLRSSSTNVSRAQA